MTAPSQLDIFTEAEARKTAGMTRAWDHASPVWKQRALAGLLHLAATARGQVQVCELRALAGIGLPERHQAWGSLPKAAAALGWLEPGGVERSKLVTTHASLLRAWYGTDRAREQHQPRDCAWCQG